MEYKEFPLFSIIVCTYNRKRKLERCLKSIFNLCYPKDRFEVIIVDGGSTDGTIELIRKKYDKIKLLVENKPGLSHARNTGVRNSKGDIIAFTDDDCIVDKQWLRALASSFCTKNVIGVGGPVYLRYPQLVPCKFLVEGALGLYNPGNKRRRIDKLIGANFAFKKEAFNITFFDTDLGRKGSRLFGLEDLDFCWKLRKRGYDLVYIPTAVVYHDIDIGRVNLWYILKRAIYEGHSISVFRIKSKKPFIRLVGSLVISSTVKLVWFTRKRTLRLFYKWLSETVAILFLILHGLRHEKQLS